MNLLINTLAIFTLLASTAVFAKPDIELYKSPTCGCCKEWAAIMEDKGYSVTVHHKRDWTSVKNRFGMPEQLTSCHTAIIDGYMIEGHVPEEDVARLLEERPKGISGLSAPGMPQHSPGMAAPGQPYKDFSVVAFDQSGKMTLYRKY
ncbi:DUF411 domain-containing protein [Vibrio breoganii]|uniref:DUF411 domain-containing protein n=1 Tax=Vibrio breoganii TaxID=553239 RepID=UPI000C81B1FB|nr:DUF411 domain-containing protein [Vibrio breoganii]PML36346.1 CopG family transcriptional regulator [Vibrio breoganii]PMM85847.1 CopG family transcriptional regulator [Vibrio breoganii]PMO75234.1 CopG family transcriptional regulator [Vibrio breoganii]PMO85119.1 CopG family transcriptional regulator [Vibrio breoganii]